MNPPFPLGRAARLGRALVLAVLASTLVPAVALAGGTKAPSNLVATAAPGAVALAWSASPESHLLSYQVYRRAADGAWPAAPAATVDAASTTFTDNGAVAGVAATYRVTATREGATESTPSNTATATPAPGGNPLPIPPIGTTTATPGPVTVQVGPAGARSFSPTSITVEPGTHVTWQWNGDNHNVTSSAGQADPFASGDRKTGAFEHVFNTAGTYRYSCTLHSGMSGTVQVSAASAPADRTPPAVPGAPTATPGDGEIVLNWPDSPDPDLAGYRIFRRVGTGAWPTAHLVVATSSVYVDSGLTNGTAYEYRVVAFDIAGNESVASATAAATPVAPPAPPPGAALPDTATIQVGANNVDRFTPISVTVALNATVTWQWSGNRHNITSDAGQADPFSSGDKTTGSFTHTFPTTGTYRYTCTLHNGMGGTIQVSAPSAPKDTAPPAAPAGLKATAGDAEIALAWTANAEADLVGYRVYRQAADARWPGTPLTTTAGTSFVDTGLTNGTAYTYRVVAFDIANNASAASATATATPVAPQPPPVDTPAATSATIQVGPNNTDRFSPAAVTVTIDPNTTNATVTWQWSGRTHNVTFEAAQPPFGSGDQSTGTLEHTFTAPGIYRYVCTLHAPGMSGTIEVRAPSAPVDRDPPAAPQAPAATGGDGTVLLDWPDSPEADVAGYRVYRSAADGTWPAAPLAEPTASQHQDTGLTNGTAYAYRVTAVDTTGNESAPSASATAAPVAPAPPATPHTTVVHVAGYAYTTPDVAIEVGDTVHWQWDGLDRNHSVTSIAGQADSFESHPGIATAAVTAAPAGGGFDHVFPTQGTFTYFCRVHPGMTGTVRVGPDARGGGGGNSGPGGSGGGNSGPGSGGSIPVPTSPITSSGPSATSGPATQIRTVDVARYAYAPATVQAVAGDTVRWRWVGPDREHTVTSTPGQAVSFESHPGVSLAKVTTGPASGVFDTRFDVPGTFTYICRLHPDMKGTVVVKERSAVAAAAAGAASAAGPRVTATTGAALRMRAVKVSVRKRARAVLSLRLSSDATVTVAARRRAPGSRAWRPFGGVRISAKAGLVRHRWRVLPRGSYRLTVKAVTASGAKTRSTVTLTVR